MARYLAMLASTILLSIASPVRSCLAVERLTLEASVDAPEYVIGQPVMVFVSARNVGEAPIEDIGPLEPLHSRLQLELSRAGEPLQNYGGFLLVAFSEEGLTLGPGQEACEMFNLLDHFGSWPPVADWLGPVLWQRSLEPGEYSLQCSFRARTGVRKDLKPLIVHANAVTFRVLPESAARAPLQRLEKLKHSSVWRRNWVSPEQAQACREQLSDLIVSPYFLKVFQCASSYLSDDELTAFVADLRKASASGRWNPAMVWYVAARAVGTVVERKKQLARLGTMPPQSIDKRIADAWTLRFDQGRYFYKR